MKSYAERGLDEIPRKNINPESGDGAVVPRSSNFGRREKNYARHGRSWTGKFHQCSSVSRNTGRERSGSRGRRRRPCRYQERLKGQGARLKLKAGPWDPRQAAISAALGGHVRIIGDDIHADPARHTAFRLGADDVEVLERLRASGSTGSGSSGGAKRQTHNDHEAQDDRTV